MSESAFCVHRPNSSESIEHAVVRRGVADVVRPIAPKFAGNAVTSRTLPPSAYALHFVLPARPRFVVICTTPFAAAVPYSAAAAGPLMISMSSMSSGFRSSRRLGF
jgi:hypothetical protein